MTPEIRKSAYSIENMAGHGKDHLEVTEIGREVLRGILYIYYRDSEGGYWYKSDIGKEMDKICRREARWKNRRKAGRGIPG